jgi:hypothetical protein
MSFILYFSKDIQSFIVRSYPDHLPEGFGNRFSLYLSTKLCHGIVLALRIQMDVFISKYTLLDTFILEKYKVWL